MSSSDLSIREQNAFSFAQEVAKQLLTLSTAIFTLTLTFLKDAAGPAPKGKTYLEVAWGCYLGAIAFGVLVLMALAGNLERAQAGSSSIYSGNIKLTAALQILLFFAGLVLTLVFGLKAT